MKSELSSADRIVFFAKLGDGFPENNLVGKTSRRYSGALAYASSKKPTNHVGHLRLPARRNSKREKTKNCQGK